MTRRLRSRIVVGLGLVGATWGALVAGCSSSDGNGNGQPDASLTCPGSLAQAIGAACAQEGQDCPIGYACGDFAEQAHCVCTKGAYACTDATQEVVAKGAQPACVGLPPPNPKECPADEGSGEGRSCVTSGLICFYVGVQCPENTVPFVDHCQCVGSASTDSGLAFHCEPHTCNPRSDASDDAFKVPDTNPPQDAGKDG